MISFANKIFKYQAVKNYFIVFDRHKVHIDILNFPLRTSFLKVWKFLVKSITSRNQLITIFDKYCVSSVRRYFSFSSSSRSLKCRNKISRSEVGTFEKGLFVVSHIVSGGCVFSKPCNEIALGGIRGGSRQNAAVECFELRILSLRWSFNTLTRTALLSG